MANFNETFLQAVLIIGLGYILKRLNIIKEKDGEALSRIIFNLTLPALIIVSFHDMTFDTSLFLLILLGFLFGIFTSIIGLFIFRKEERKTKGMLTMLVSGFNIGLFAYPLVEGIWGKEGIQYFAMFDVGNAFIVFGTIYLIGSYYATDQAALNFKSIVRKLTRSIPLMTYLTVCLLAIINVQLPSIVINISDIIASANMPLSFLLLGIYLSFSLDKTYRKQMIKVLTIRYVVGLIIGISLFFLLPLNPMFRYTILLGLILPISVSVLPYSVEFKYDQKFVGTVSNVTILISFLLLWIIANLLIS